MSKQKSAPMSFAKYCRYMNIPTDAKKRNVDDRRLVREFQQAGLKQLGYR